MPVGVAMGIASLHPSYATTELSRDRETVSTVIASEAKQSMPPNKKEWIASLRSQ
jgi:hypothetical protein